MLAFDPTHRISAREALQHPWLNNANSSPLDMSSAKNVFTNLKSFHSGAETAKSDLRLHCLAAGYEEGKGRDA
jgi:serine/threonine protein kinase